VAFSPEFAGKAILQDRGAILAQIPADVHRVALLVAHEILKPQVILGADIYYLFDVLCQWPDEECITILTNQAAAMEPESRLLISQAIVPEDGRVDALLAGVDLALLTFGGAERTLKQMEEMLESAGLVIDRVWQERGSIYDVIEAILPE
jgi:hypothetical protein